MRNKIEALKSRVSVKETDIYWQKKIDLLKHEFGVYLKKEMKAIDDEQLQTIMAKL